MHARLIGTYAVAVAVSALCAACPDPEASLLDAQAGVDASSNPDAHPGDARVPDARVDAGALDVAPGDAPVIDSGAADSGGTDTGTTAGATVDVTADSVDLFHLEDGTVETLPYDFSLDVIQAQVLDLQGGYQSYPGSGGANGQLLVRAVPAGRPYLLSWTIQGISPPLVFVPSTGTTHLELGGHALGRSAAPFLYSTTEMALVASGMAPWEDGDQLALFSAGAGTFTPNLELLAFLGAPQPNDTELMLGFDYASNFGARAIDGAQGDRMTVMQLEHSQPAPGIDAWTLSRMMEPAPFTLIDGQPITVAGTFAAAPPAESAGLDWRIDRYQQAAAEISAGSGVQTLELTARIHALPNLAAAGRYHPGVTLLSLAATGTTASFVQTVSYPGAFPAYERGAEAHLVIGVPVLARGATTPLMVRGSVNSEVLLTSGAPTVLEPALTPPRNLRANGLDASGRLDGLGTRVELSWDAPSTGTPSGYNLTLYRLRNDAGTTRRVVLGYFTVSGTSLLLPPGMLTAGNEYLLVVSAAARLGPELGAAPYFSAVPFHTASTISGVLAP